MAYLTAALLMILCFNSKAQELPIIETTIPLKEVYIPKGLDSNDNGQIIVTGVLPNLCFQNPTVEIHKMDKEITLKAKASLNTQNILLCPQVVVPFVLVADLGVLPAATYRVLAVGVENKEELNVTVATSDHADDYIYAQVTSIEVENQSRTVILHASSPSYCLQFDRVEFIPSKNKKTLAILPIMKRVSPRCPQKITPFKIKVDIPEEYARDNLLLHVRSMDGQSVNAIYRYFPLAR